jgi:hypothetical protein
MWVLCASLMLAHPYAPVADLGQDSTVHRLATFALASLHQPCAMSNSIGCARIFDVTSLSVTEASRQIVSGVNYRIECELHGPSVHIGSLHLALYEQWWTQMLRLEAATISVPVGGSSEAILTSDLIDAPLTLDEPAFRAMVDPSPLLLGGAPLTNETFGGHYLSSDSNAQRKPPEGLRTESPAEPRLDFRLPASMPHGALPLVLLLGGIMGLAQLVRRHRSVGSSPEYVGCASSRVLLV